jgi:hypothetical protein
MSAETIDYWPSTIGKSIVRAIGAFFVVKREMAEISRQQGKRLVGRAGLMTVSVFRR